MTHVHRFLHRSRRRIGKRRNDTYRSAIYPRGGQDIPTHLLHLRSPQIGTRTEDHDAAAEGAGRRRGSIFIGERPREPPLLQMDGWMDGSRSYWRYRLSPRPHSYQGRSHPAPPREVPIRRRGRKGPLGAGYTHMHKGRRRRRLNSRAIRRRLLPFLSRGKGGWGEEEEGISPAQTASDPPRLGPHLMSNLAAAEEEGGGT